MGRTSVYLSMIVTWKGATPIAAVYPAPACLAVKTVLQQAALLSATWSAWVRTTGLQGMKWRGRISSSRCSARRQF